ncbi:peptidase associated/transthyretin-like domain-containing protein [Micromonospora auratinigra]|uniref:Carboxypeptidase regulatory-like domain-containing protein n=1 Tax=Micromonospora auratinigra TaxID=261654 RepID=A0A1A9A2L7_9ACTN|nr:hypothetical protein [Micromonospora auratinigra]SBT50331.1 Carboxypeptidase regulatory-like domain-containing protein [Micromonospora auratinigra]
MSTHRRAWKQRAGVVVALAFGALLTVPATPAFAASVNVAPGSATVNAGSDTTLTVTITPGTDDKNGDLSLSGLPSGVSCSSGCGGFTFNGPPGSPKVQLITVRANDNAPDANGTSVTVRVQGVSEPATANFNLTVKAKAAPQPTEAQTVKSISGKVIIAANSEPISGAVVMLRDGQGKLRQTNSDGSGNFKFSGSASDPIAPGRLDLGASKDGKQITKSIDAAAGDSKTGLRLAVPVEVKATPSATPSASAEALPTDEATDEVTEGPSSEAPAAAAQPTAKEDSGGSWLLILLGGLFVAVGVGTIVLLYMRRKNEGDDADTAGPGGAAAAGAVPVARGGYRGAEDQTRVVGGMGAGPAPTMVGGTSLSDAPTMMHRPVVDDVPPDPYGAPPASGYGGGQGGWAGGGYGDEPAPGGYGANGYGNAPSSGGGYGNAPASGGGYGDRDYGAGAGGYPPAQGGGYGNERYDEPTGRYTGDSTQYAPPADPYPTSTYQPGADQAPGYGAQDQGHYGRGGEPDNGYGGYGAQGGYDGAADQGGYDNTRGYDNAPARGGYEGGPARGGYDAPPTGGYDAAPGGGYEGGQNYDQRGGYGGNDGYGQQPQQGGYGQPGGYGQEPPPQQRTGGYDDQGYDQGGYYADPAQAGRGRPDGPPERGGRRLDWLDD